MLQQQQQRAKRHDDAVNQADRAELSMIFGMRLLLAIAALLTLLINPGHPGVPVTVAWLSLSVYLLHSATLFFLLHFNFPVVRGKLIYWLDVLWGGMIVFASGGSNSYFFPFFFFVILASSFQRGVEEGTRMTLASCVLLIVAALAAPVSLEVPHLLLRTTFVMALGYMIAYWGGLGLLQKRRLALLREVSQQSNPRFGVDQTVASILEKTREFFNASSCTQIMREIAAERWQLRSAVADGAPHTRRVSDMSEAAVAPLLVFDARQSVLYAPVLRARLGWGSALQALERGGAKWQRLDAARGAVLAELFDARSFISAPLPMLKGEGRLYITSPKHDFNRADVRFLLDIINQVFPLIENIALLDRLASGAAYRERQKIARDLHDTTIQPYIGLRHGLEALRARAAPDNPLCSELDKLVDMSGQVIVDLRRMAQSVKSGAHPAQGPLLDALRRQAEQLKKFFGIDIEIAANSGFDVSDRLAAEIFQIVNEGMSNIRKHTTARDGRVTLARDARRLTIAIENSCDASEQAGFMPASIAERVQSLGGTVRVGALGANSVAVRIDIPV